MTYPQVIEDDIKKMIEKYEKYVAKTSSKNTDYTINDVEYGHHYRCHNRRQCITD